MQDNKPTIDDMKALEAKKVSAKSIKKVEESSDNIEKMLAEYEHLDKTELPHKILYPENWELFYKKPTVDDVAVFSTIPENDYFKIMLATIQLIRKCMLIIDSETQKLVSTERIKSCHKMFLFLKLRTEYMTDSKGNTSDIMYPIFSPELEEAITVKFNEYSLIYDELSDDVVAILNEERTGFIFDESFGYDEPIYIPITDFGMEIKIINHITNSHKKMQKTDAKKKDFDSFDKKFLAFLPYLFEKSTDTIDGLKNKYKLLMENESKYQAYLELVTNFKIGEKDNIKYVVEREGETIVGETPMKFPNGYNGLFIRETVKSKLFK